MNKRKTRILSIYLFLAVTFLFINLNNKIYAKENLKYRKNITQKTNYGEVKGTEIYNGKTLVWKGIPYAKAPVGELRWKAPVEPNSWDGVFDATKSGDIGIQVSTKGFEGSENCLNLDIYRPNTDQKDLPVFFYIHGGNNQSGNSAEINPKKFVVNANVIVVSINYRLGILGFNNLPALKTGNKYEDSGNFTLLDISRALDWVKENIENFGGNKTNITIAGFSAGGRDVMAMLISPIFKGKFQKAISFSGGMTIANYSESQEIYAKALAPLAVQDKKKKNEEEAIEWLMSSKKEVHDYLYKISAKRLAALMQNASIRMAAFPHLLNDGVVIPKDGFSTKHYNNVPLIMVTGSSEFSLFGRFDKVFVKYKDDQLLDDSSKISKEYAFVYKYGNRLYALFNAQESAERMFDNYKAPIYTVDFDWGTNKKVFGKRTANLFGPLHGIWIPFLMDDVQGASILISNSLKKNKGVEDLSNKFTKYISDFLYKDNPNSKKLVEWKKWIAAKMGYTQLILDADNNHAIIKMSEERESYNKILEDMENDTSLSKQDKDRLIKTVLDGRWFSKKLDRYFHNTNPWIQIY